MKCRDSDDDLDNWLLIRSRADHVMMTMIDCDGYVCMCMRICIRICECMYHYDYCDIIMMIVIMIW
jgi:hypothetical protein